MKTVLIIVFAMVFALGVANRFTSKPPMTFIDGLIFVAEVTVFMCATIISITGTLIAGYGVGCAIMRFNP